MNKGLSFLRHYGVVSVGKWSTKILIYWQRKLATVRKLREGEAGMAQWSEHLPPTNVVRARFRDSASYVGWECSVGSRPCSLRIFPGTRVFPFPQKPTHPNSNSIWISVPPIISAFALLEVQFETIIKLFISSVSPSPERSWQIQNFVQDIITVTCCY